MEDQTKISRIIVEEYEHCLWLTRNKYVQEYLKTEDVYCIFAMTGKGTQPGMQTKKLIEELPNAVLLDCKVFSDSDYMKQLCATIDYYAGDGAYVDIIDHFDLYTELKAHIGDYRLKHHKNFKQYQKSCRDRRKLVPESELAYTENMIDFGADINLDAVFGPEPDYPAVVPKEAEETEEQKDTRQKEHTAPDPPKEKEETPKEPEKQPKSRPHKEPPREQPKEKPERKKKEAPKSKQDKGRPKPEKEPEPVKRPEEESKKKDDPPSDQKTETAAQSEKEPEQEEQKKPWEDVKRDTPNLRTTIEEVIFREETQAPKEAPDYGEFALSRDGYAFALRRRLCQDICKYVDPYFTKLDETKMTRFIDLLLRTEDFAGFEESWRVMEPDVSLKRLMDHDYLYYRELKAQARYYQETLIQVYEKDFFNN